MQFHKGVSARKSAKYQIVEEDINMTQAVQDREKTQE